ncbi:hypothetical protein J6590_022577 [Homalodisca vitripennis]|nr:hypothetical protein J6590_022577 [Homalodisca vitripennis]
MTTTRQPYVAGTEIPLELQGLHSFEYHTCKNRANNARNRSKIAVRSWNKNNTTATDYHTFRNCIYLSARNLGYIQCQIAFRSWNKGPIRATGAALVDYHTARNLGYVQWLPKLVHRSHQSYRGCTGRLSHVLEIRLVGKGDWSKSPNKKNASLVSHHQPTGFCVQENTVWIYCEKGLIAKDWDSNIVLLVREP